VPASDSPPGRHPLGIAFESGDRAGVAEALADDVVLRSPGTELLRFEGREEVSRLLWLVRETFEDLRNVAEFGEGDTRAIIFRAQVDGHELEGADIVRLDEKEKVCDITVFVRPLPGLTALMAALAPSLVAEGGRARSMIATGFLRPFAAASRLGDAAGARLLKGAATRAIPGASPVGPGQAARA
jgi:SnoaL-like protein